MSAEELRRHLEYFQDLGIRELNIAKPGPIQPLPAAAKPMEPRRPPPPAPTTTTS